MDDLDRKILALLAKNARMPVKEIAEKVALTSPAVSSRIHKLETDGIISGYTVMLNRPSDRVYAVSYTHLLFELSSGMKNAYARSDA